MDILKNEIELPKFHFKLKKIKEKNIHLNKTREYFLMYLNDEIIPFSFSTYNNEFIYKTEIIRIEDLETLLTTVLEELNNVELNNFEKIEKKNISIEIFDDKIDVENYSTLFKHKVIYYYGSDEDTEIFVKNIKDTIELISQIWKLLNIPEITILKEY